MALATHATGSITTTAAEQTIGSALTSGKTAYLDLDAANMVAGDEVHIIAYTKVLTGSTARVYRRWVLRDAQGSEPNYQSPPIGARFSLEFKIIRIAGTDRSFDYTIVTID